MDINKYLKKAGYDIKKITSTTITVIDVNNNIKEINIKDTEKYLFICLLDYIKSI